MGKHGPGIPPAGPRRAGMLPRGQGAFPLPIAPGGPAVPGSLGAPSPFAAGCPFPSRGLGCLGGGLSPVFAVPGALPDAA